ncbi:MAG: Nre family DNA repair protein [Candidatus Altiarchaeota archaeon]
MPRQVKHQSWENPRCEILKAMYSARPMSRQMCLQCKGGRLLCGHDSCPLLRKISLQHPVSDSLSDHMFGPSTSVFVGWKDYPRVFAGPMTAVDAEDPGLLDNPGEWYGKGFDDIIQMRSMLVRSKQQHNVREQSRFVEGMRELALSVKPVDVETLFKSKPSYSLSFSPISQPMGPSGVLDRMTITENPRIPRKVDYIVSDDLKSTTQMSKLYGCGHDVYYITNILASGVLGMKDSRKMVPTRWSITAVDDMLGKTLLSQIRDYPEVTDFMVYHNTYLENHFEVLLIPGSWEFEQFEAWAPRTLWTLSYDKPVIQLESEYYRGRKDYAFKEGGGYYASRLAVAEALDGMRRQARVVVFREIYDSYVMPVGVWEVRENVRKAMQSKPSRFTTLRAALDDVNERLLIPVGDYVAKSELLKQRRITDYT